MSTMNVSLPESLRKYVEDRVDSGGYGSASEFFRELIRQDQKRAAEAALDQKLLEGLNSGPSAPMTKQDWQQLRQQIIERRDLQARRDRR